MQMKSYYVTKEEAEQIIPYLKLVSESGPEELQQVAYTLTRKMSFVRGTEEDFPLRGEQTALTMGGSKLMDMVISALGLPDLSRP